MKSIGHIISVLVVLLVPTFAFADTFTQSSVMYFSGGVGGPVLAGCTGTICGVANTILYIINNILVPVLFAIAFIVFLYGIYKAYIYSAGDPEEVAKGHKLVLWGLIAFAVMISVWGLVNVVANTLSLNGILGPGRLPTSY